MSPQQIHDAFDALLTTGNANRERQQNAGMSSQQAATYRYVMKKRHRIKLETKLHWLRQSGMPVDDSTFYRKTDMVAFASFALHPKNKKAIPLGLDYLLDKWHAMPARANKANTQRTGAPLKLECIMVGTRKYVTAEEIKGWLEYLKAINK